MPALLAGLITWVLFPPLEAVAQTGARSPGKGACKEVEFEADVKAGQAVDVVFAAGLRFLLEPLASGWIVRVLAANEPRGPHDYAELATPPYTSVSPLLLSTDWSFRAQDAVGWNPRRFRYAANKPVFEELAALYPKVMAGDGKSSSRAAALVSQQPEGVIEILDAQLAPGLANQARMAAPVAGHFTVTPHSIDQNAAASALGKIEELKLRVILEVAAGERPAAGLRRESKPCTTEPLIQPAIQRTAKQGTAIPGTKGDNQRQPTRIPANEQKP
jgi:hypothetical protein